MPVTFGQLIGVVVSSTLTLTIIIVAAYVSIRERLAVLEHKVGPLWDGYTERRHLAHDDEGG